MVTTDKLLCQNRFLFQWLKDMIDIRLYKTRYTGLTYNCKPVIGAVNFG